jgi:hypothetical protein
VCNGLPPPAVFDTYDHTLPQQDPLAGIPIHIRFRKKLSQIITIANLELGRIALSADTAIGATATKSIIDLNMWQLDQHEKTCPDPQSR